MRIILGLCLGILAASPPPADLVLLVGDAKAVEGEDFSLYFKEVRSDSRCPRDAQCFWAGEAIVVLEVRPGEGEPTDVTLSVPPGGGAERTFRGCHLRLLTLEPENESGRRLEQKDYRAMLRVERETGSQGVSR
jgi:hypothetical protein